MWWAPTGRSPEFALLFRGLRFNQLWEAEREAPRRKAEPPTPIPLDQFADVGVLGWAGNLTAAEARTCADLAPDGWLCETHGDRGVAGCYGPWMPPTEAAGG